MFAALKRLPHYLDDVCLRAIENRRRHNSSAAIVQRIDSSTDLVRTGRRIRRELRSKSVLVSGEFPRIKTIYAELVDRMPASERTNLQRLSVPLVDGRPELIGLPAGRERRRVGRNFPHPALPLEHLLLVNDFTDAQKLIESLFPGYCGAPAIRFNDPKGNLSLGQYRDTIAAIRSAGSDPQARSLNYAVERWADYSTFCPAVRVLHGTATVLIDVAQLEGSGAFRAALERELLTAREGEESAALDDAFVRYDQTRAWSFNQAFWRFLAIWERVTGKDYQRALPKGKSESHHPEFIAEAAETFASHVTELEREGAIAPGDELWFHEKAPGSGEFTAGLLEHLREHYPGYYSRMRVVLSEVSAQVLALAAGELQRRGVFAPHNALNEGPRIFFRDLSLSTEPVVQQADGSIVRLEGRFLYFRHANFFDQLPTRLFAKTAGRFYEIYVQAIVPQRKLAALEQRHGLALDELLAVIDGGSDLNAMPADEQARMVGFWSEVWAAMKFRESYRPLDDFPQFHPYGEVLSRVLAELDNVRFVSSDWAIETLMADLELLHPQYGYACFTDVFLQRVNEFRERWIELAKYDNGVWVGTNAVLMTELLARSGYETDFYPVELTLGEPTPVYTLTVRKRQTSRFNFPPAVLQQLTSIERSALSDIALEGLPRRVRNNFRELTQHLPRLEHASDWSARLTESLGLSALLREFYYRSGSEMSEHSPFTRLVALVAELLCRYRGQALRIEPELGIAELKDLEDFLDHRPIGEPPLDLVENGGQCDGVQVLRLRLPTLVRRLESGQFVVLAEVDLARNQSVERLRRRIFQFQSHVDAVSITSGRLADPRFMRSRELLESPLLDALRPDRLVVTLEMRDRRADELEADFRAFEDRGVRNFFILTGDFERNSQWWLDSIHGLQVADRLRNERRFPAGSRTLLAGALAWSGIPDQRSRIERDVILKLRAGVDLLFTQPVYDLDRALRALEIISDYGLDRCVHIVPEVLPIATLEQMRTLSEAPGILVPRGMTAAYRHIAANVEKFCQTQPSGPEAERRNQFADGLFRGVPSLAGYEDLFTPELAAEIHGEMSSAMASARRKSTQARETEQALKAARETVLFEVAFALTRRAMAALAGHRAVSGFLIVARNGRELRRISAEARALGIEGRR